MSDDDSDIMEAFVHRQWRRVERSINQLNDRASDDPDSFDSQPGSSLATDDAASSPFRVSVAVKCCFDAGVDHLHALKSLILDAGLLHLAAPFSLARGAIENFAVAAWMLTGEGPDQRVERVLRWQAKNLVDGMRATRDKDPAGSSPLAERWGPLDEVAGRNALGRAYRGGYTSTEVVKASQDAFPSIRSGLLFPWQLCSGFAHGRPWAVHGGSHQERHDDAADPSMVVIRLNSSLTTVLYPTLAAVELMEAVIELYDDRAQTH